MKNRLMPLLDRILLRKRSVIETINDELKNICNIEHSRHRAIPDFIMNLIAALEAYCFFDRKPSIKVNFEPQFGQLALFYYFLRSSILFVSRLCHRKNIVLPSLWLIRLEELYKIRLIIIQIINADNGFALYQKSFCQMKTDKTCCVCYDIFHK
jgi:hypothetical protein